MREVTLEAYAKKYGRKGAANLIGCHWTLISDVIKKKRKVFIVLDKNEAVIDSYEVKPFPNKRMSIAKQQKAPVEKD